ncbi:hypothetical protein G9A89_012703 [Geosiphon pyriformis]|nr:hypothetical protein G9A89_012703 [Geosiphon pyriformis]
MRETFYHKLIQNTSLSTNHNFTSIIIEINKEIEHHTQQRYPITYLSKGKKKLQTPAKHKVESPTNLSYYYTLGKIQLPLSPPDFGIANLWEASELEEERESEDQEFTYQNPIPENLEQIQQPQQQLQPPIQQQQPNVDPITYTPIAKLNNFTGEEDDAQVWLNDVEKAITING